MPKSYLVQEEDGISRFILEEGDGFILLEEWSGVGVVEGDDYGAGIVVGDDAAVASAEGATVGAVRATGIVEPT